MNSSAAFADTTTCAVSSERGQLVAIRYQLYDGNQADVTTHIPNWQGLRELLGGEDFIYVADSKLCAYENLGTIAEQGAQFITVVPRNFREVKGFLERVRNGEDIQWQCAYEVPDSRKKGRTHTYRIHIGEPMTDGGYRILWIHSQGKERLERTSREKRIDKAEQALEKLSSGLDALRKRILALLKVPVTIYRSLRDRWWMFALE